MDLNISTLFWADILSGIPIVIGFLVSAREFFKQRLRQNFCLAGAWLSMVIWQYGLALAELTLSIPIKRTSDYFLIFACIFICILMDAVSKESIDPIKMSITHILGAIVIVTSFYSDAIIVGARVVNGPTSIYTNSWFKYSGAILLIFLGFVIVIYIARIYLASPKSLKKYASIVFIGALLATLITPIGFLGGISDSVPGLTNLVMGIGLLLVAIGFAKEPKLGYVLPFKALRLTIINTESGIAIFTHDWTKDESLVDNVLFSGMMQGISGILNESLKKGNIKEIILDKANLLIEHSPENPQTACILVATKSTIGLRTALTNFTHLFVKEFAAVLGNTNEISQFDRASVFVDECFPFVPIYE